MTDRFDVHKEHEPNRSGGNAPSVSVVLIVRNGEAFIAEALESVFQSEVQPLEILVIDGNSSDNTAEIARRFPATRVVRQESEGIANAYNQGIELAKGELIAFISHDDIWMGGKLDLQTDYMGRHPSAQFTVTMVEHFLAAGVSVPPGFRVELLNKPVAGFIMEALMVRKSLFDIAGRFDPGFSVGEDTDWFARLKDMGVAGAVLPGVLVRKRVHGSNSSLAEKNINALLLRAMRNSVRRKQSDLKAVP